MPFAVHGGGLGASPTGPYFFFRILLCVYFWPCVGLSWRRLTSVKHRTDPQVRVPNPPPPRAPLTTTSLLLSFGPSAAVVPLPNFGTAPGEVDEPRAQRPRVGPGPNTPAR